MSRVGFPELDFAPIETGEAVAWVPDEMKVLAQIASEFGQETILRGVTLDYPGCTDLAEGCNTAKKVLKEAASALGVAALEPRYGLHKKPPGITRPLGRSDGIDAYSHAPGDLIPNGYALIAEVPILSGVRDPDIEDIYQVIKHARIYYSDKFRNGGPALGDVKAQQVKRAHIGNGPKRLVYVDADVRVVTTLHDISEEYFRDDGVDRA